MQPSIYAQLHARKRPWQPTCGKAEPVAPGSEDTIGRCLALRVLEIPVAQWVGDGTSRELSRLGEDAIALLRSNCEDEVRHDQALTLAADAYRLGSPQVDRDAQAIASQWIDHPDHPIVKAAVLENSIFFVILPLLRKFGGAGLRTVSYDISTDESIHAPANRQAAADLGYWYSPSLDKLRDETVRWLVSTLDAPGKHGLPDVWIESSARLLATGNAPALSDTQAYVMPAFFEHSNTNLPVYY